MNKIVKLGVISLSLFLSSCTTNEKYYVFDGVGNNNPKVVPPGGFETPTYVYFFDIFNLDIPHIVKGEELFNSLKIKSPIKLSEVTEDLDSIDYYFKNEIFTFSYSSELSFNLRFESNFTRLFYEEDDKLYKLDLSEDTVLNLYNYVIDYGTHLPYRNELY